MYEPVKENGIKIKKRKLDTKKMLVNLKDKVVSDDEDRRKSRTLKVNRQRTPVKANPLLY